MNIQFPRVHFLLLVSYLLTSGSAIYAQTNEVVIGVFSPLSGNSMHTGIAHRFWTIQGFNGAGNTLSSRRGLVNIELINVDTRSDDPLCGEKLQTFLQNHSNAAAIIGPVRSGCMEHMQQINASIPIVSSLASATDLTMTEQEWFFRANTNDRTRLQELLRHVQQSPDRYGSAEKILFYDNKSKYGLGLREDFAALEPNVDVFSIEQASETSFGLPELINGKHVFVLGNSSETLEFGRAIADSLLPDTFFFTIGVSPRLREWRRDNTFTIGEVRFPESEAVFAMNERRRIEDIVVAERMRFYPTVYSTSRFILHSALESAIERLEGEIETNIEQFRSLIRDELRTPNEFQSLNPPHVLKFDENNDLEGEFDYPIFQLVWDLVPTPPLERPSNAWIEVSSPTSSFSFLESPITVSVTTHGLNGNQTELRLVDEDGTPVSTKQIENLTDNAPEEITFHVIKQGEYHLEARHTLYPPEPRITVQFTSFYLFCLVASIIGVVCRQRPNSLMDLGFAYALIEGIAFSIAIAFVITYFRYDIVPVVNTGWNVVNAVFYGLVVGYLTPYLIHEVLLDRFTERNVD